MHFVGKCCYCAGQKGEGRQGATALPWGNTTEGVDKQHRLNGVNDNMSRLAHELKAKLNGVKYLRVSGRSRPQAQDRRDRPAIYGGLCAGTAGQHSYHSSP